MPPPDQGQKQKVLLVEDDVFMVELLSHELVNSGFDTTVAKSGTEGVQKFDEAKPDIVLLDIILSDMNGLDVLRKIRETEYGKNVKVIILSNVAEGQHKEDARALNASDYLVKANYTLTEIVEKIREVLRN